MEKKKDRTILVVDDEEDIRRVVARLLESRGYRVMTASSGLEALKIFEEGAPVDLLILDLLMPDMDGYETLAHVKDQADGPKSVIMLTAKSASHDIMKGYRVGADYYISKPFKNQILIDSVNYLIGDLSEAERTALETRL